MLNYQKAIRNGFCYRTGKIPVFTDEEIRNLKTPCYVIVGSDDLLLSSKDTRRRVKELLPAARILYLEGEGHALVNVTKEVCNFLH